MAEAGRKPGLRGRSYWALIVTQFLGAFNDNIYRMIVVLFVSVGLSSTKGGAIYLCGATAVFALAYILFSSSAGWLADRLSKRTVIVWSKVAEIAVMALAFAALSAGDRITPIVVLFLAAVQATFFSPAKYGILPEILDDEELSQGNGIINMTTYLAIITGTVVGGWLMGTFSWLSGKGTAGHYEGWLAGTVLIPICLAIIGTVTSTFIAPIAAAGSRRPFRWNFLAESIDGVRRVRADKPLFLAMLANMYVWVFGAVFIQNFAPYAWEIMKVEQPDTISNLIGAMCVGIALGSLLAGKLSGRKIELGLVPLGAIGMTVCSLAFAFVHRSVYWTGANLLVLGVFTGLYVVPLNAFIQQRSPKTAKGGTIATLNFITFSGMLVGAVGVFLMAEVAQWNPAGIFVAFGVITVAVTIYICRTLPDFLIRFAAWCATHTVYRIRVVGVENVPKDGPALLVCNHVSLVDACLVTACFQRFVRFIMYRAYYEHPLLNWAARPMRAIPISPDDGPRALLDAFARARKALVEDRDLVCIFAEDSVTRTGNLLGFHSGFERIVRGTDVPVIPVHLDRVWGSIFSWEGERVVWKWPKALPYPVTVSFGTPMRPGASAHEVRTAVAELAADAFDYRTGAQVLLHHAFVRSAKLNWWKPCVADSTGASMRYGELLVASIILSRRIRRLESAGGHVGILLPPSVGAVVANLATLFAGRVPVNLNYTAPRDGIESAIAQCRISAVITSRRFLEKTNLPDLPGTVMIEDIVAGVPGWEKAATAAEAYCLPACALRRRYSRPRLRPDQPATVIFSSGTTGAPKGVLLSHKNIAANIVGFCQVLSFRRDDCLCGVLPFFHSFGFTATLWTPLLRHFRCVYHPNPLDAKTVGRLVREQAATHLICTPTFLAAYTRQCEPDDFKSLRTVVVGAEKMRPSIADAFEAKFGIHPLEGYGCTELSPVAALNVPDRAKGDGQVQVGTKEGTIGQPLPNVAAKVVDLESGEALAPNEEGLLLIKGPSVMLGYLGQPERTAEVIRDGWYQTGDLARIDEDGFITISGRMSRFSKIAGEMIPHMAVEEAIHRVLGAPPGEILCVVTSVPDERRGERLVVLHKRLPIGLDELWDRLNATSLPKLWIPKKEMFLEVAEIPVLGSGKLALDRIRRIALDASHAD